MRVRGVGERGETEHLLDRAQERVWAVCLLDGLPTGVYRDRTSAPTGNGWPLALDRLAANVIRSTPSFR